MKFRLQDGDSVLLTMLDARWRRIRRPQSCCWVGRYQFQMPSARQEMELFVRGKLGNLCFMLPGWLRGGSQLWSSLLLCESVTYSRQDQIQET